MATWNEGITDRMKYNNDSWENVEQCTLSESELNKEFDCGFGGEEGEPFTIWTENYIYFPACYDGSEWVESVSRHPDGKATPHIGG